MEQPLELTRDIFPGDLVVPPTGFPYFVISVVYIDTYEGIRQSMLIQTIGKDRDLEQVQRDPQASLAKGTYAIR